MYKAIAAAVLFGLYTWFIYGAGQDSIVAGMAETVQTAVKAARADEQLKQDKINTIAQEQYDEIAIINNRLNTDLDKLRNRPNRRHLPESARANCKGVTGAELSSEDGRFLVREAARADRFRTALKACYRYADSVTADATE